MKKKTTMTALFLLLVHLTFANDGYVKKMKETIDQLNNFESVEGYIRIANQFEVIGKAEKEEWLPWYYHANTYMLLVYLDADADFEKKSQYLAIAGKSLEKISKQFPEESEIEVLNAFLAISHMAIDPAAAAQYLPGYSQAVAKAASLDPENPRARFFQLSSKIGEAQFFGQPTDSFCPALNQLLAEWDSYKTKSAIHPSWGKDEVPKKIAECGCQ